MGMMDRDYVRGGAGQRPYSPPPERSTTSYLTIVCIVAAGMFGLYKGADWLLQQRTARLVSQPLRTLPPAASVTPARPIEPPLSTRPVYPSPGQQALTSQTVTKCVTMSKTSYSDGACGKGAVSTQIVTRSNHNMMDAVQIPVMAQPLQPAQHTIVVQNDGRGAQGLASQKAFCKSLDEEIARLDALARQPQSAQMQDWISAERKKLRDAQFRLPCR